MIINQSIHVYAEDKIEAKAGDAYNWVCIGETTLHASVADLERIRDAINACILDKLVRANPAKTRPIVHSLSACNECGAQGEDFTGANVEAFEVTGELVCEDCADAVLAREAEYAAEDAAQPDEAQEWADFDRDC